MGWWGRRQKGRPCCSPLFRARHSSEVKAPSDSYSIESRWNLACLRGLLAWMNAVLCGMSDAQAGTDRWMHGAPMLTVSRRKNCVWGFVLAMPNPSPRKRPWVKKRSTEGCWKLDFRCKRTTASTTGYDKQEHRYSFFPRSVHIYRGTQTVDRTGSSALLGNKACRVFSFLGPCY
jgi:hypothetical protein